MLRSKSESSGKGHDTTRIDIRRIFSVMVAVMLVSSSVIIFLNFGVAPVQAADGDTTGSTTITDFAVDVEYKNDKAYVLTYSNTLEVYDVSDPASPTSLGSFSFSNYSTSTKDLDLQIDESDGLAILTAADSSESTPNRDVLIMDVSDPSTMSILDNISNPNIENIAVDRDTNTFYGISQADNSISSYDYSTPSSVSQLATGGSVDTQNSIISLNDKAGSQDYLYASNPTDKHIKVFDVSDPSALGSAVYTSSSLFGSSPSDADYMAFTGPDTMVYAGTSEVYTVDISSPASSVSVADTLTNGTTNSHVTSDGGIVSVADEGDSETDYYSVDDSRTLTKTSTVTEDQYPAHEYRAEGYMYRVNSAGDTFLVEEAPQGSTGQTIAGQAVNQNGDPVANATIQINLLNYQQATTDVTSNEELGDDLTDPTPSSYTDKYESWNPVSLSDSGELSGNYVAVNTVSEWGLKPWQTAGEVGTVHNQIDAGEPVVLSCWNPEKDPFLQNDIDEERPGVTEKCTIEVTSLGPEGSETGTFTVETNSSETASLDLSYKDNYYTQQALAEGYYRISPQNSDVSRVIQVGNPAEIPVTDVKDEADNLTKRAQDFQDRKSENATKKIVVETDQNGEFSTTVGSQWGDAQIYAYKGGKLPDSEKQLLGDVNLQDRSVSTLAQEAKSKDYTGSVSYSTTMLETGLPASNLTLEMRETPEIKWGDIGDLQDIISALNDLIKAEDYTDLGSISDIPLVNQTDEEVKDTAEDVEDVVKNSPDRVKGSFGNISGGLGGDSITEENIVRIAEQVFKQSSADMESELTESTIEDGKLSQTIQVDQDILKSDDLSKDGLHVRAHLTDGTSETVPDEYISINGDEIAVEGYPIDGASGASLTVIAATEDTLAKDRTQTADNPAVSGGIPHLNSLNLNSLRPVEGEEVSVTATPPNNADEFNGVVDSTVYGPDGNTVSSSVNSGEVTFTPSQDGRHLVKVGVQNSAGKTIWTTQSLKVADVDEDMPPGVRLVESNLGTYAVVGDGAESAKVDVASGAADVEVEVRESATRPVHVYSTEISEPSTNYDISLGDTQGNSLQNREVYIHSADLKEDAIVERNDEFLITGENGEISEQDSSTLIRTYTDSDGEVSVTVDNDPSIFKELWYDANRYVPFL